jgi:hypothetical protein
MKVYTRGQNACYIYVCETAGNRNSKLDHSLVPRAGVCTMVQSFELWYKLCTVVQMFELWYKFCTVVQMFGLWYKVLDRVSNIWTVCHRFGLWNRCLEHVSE